MLGDGSIQGRPVESNQSSRCQFFILMTWRSAFNLRSALAMVASSPSVRPWRTGMSKQPVKLCRLSSSIGPSTWTPVMGLGRSRT